MLTAQGKYGEAIIYTDNIEQEAYAQTIKMMNVSIFENQRVRIMPDVHAGKASVIGFTSTFNNYVCPNIVGVDIGCGVSTVQFTTDEPIDLNELDTFIRRNIPYGFGVHSKVPQITDMVKDNFVDRCDKTVKKIGLDTNRVLKSIGTLGSGNHFIELGMLNDIYYLTVHSGSRNFGLQIAQYHQKIAYQQCLDNNIELPHKDLAYLVDSTDYLEDLDLAQTFALINRTRILSLILEALGSKAHNRYSGINSTHNYIDLQHKIIRKGAISAQKDELLLIPLNMRDGILLCKGKGNAEWNCSAPHGAGRLYSRSKAKKELSLEDFKQSMEGIYSSCISEHTLDECPAAYKNATEIYKAIEPTCEVIGVIQPIYNFKA